MSIATPSPACALELQSIAFSYPARSDSGNGRLYAGFSLTVGLGSILALMGPRE